MTQHASHPLQFESPDDWRKFQSYLKDESRYVLTPRWENFIRTLEATSGKREWVITKNSRLARARIGAVRNSKKSASHELQTVRPLSHDEMIGPPRKKAVEGRLNPSGIPYLYLANNKETAIAEVRPWVGAYVTVVYFRLKEDQRLIDLTKDFPQARNQHARNGEKKARANEDLIWSQINQSFSEPVSPDDRRSQYVHTQYVTEIFKCHGFQGIRYKSSLFEHGYNYLLFNPRVVEFIRSFAVKVNGVRYHWKS